MNISQLLANWFTAITGIATLISVFLQLRGTFPGYSNFIERAIYILSGLFVGSVIGNVRISSISISLGTSGLYYLVLLVQFIAAVAAIYLVLDQARRKVSHDPSLTVLLFIFFSLFLYHIVVNFPHISYFSLQDYALLADNAEKKGDLARAIDYYKEMENQFKDKLSPEQRSALDEKIQELTAKSLQLK